MIGPASAIFDRSVLLLLATRLGSNGGNQMQATIVGWTVYQMTDSPWSIAFVGLTQFLPPLFLTLIAGQVADSFDRKMILSRCFAVEMTMSASLALLMLVGVQSVLPIYGLLLVNATARAFEAPATNSLLALVVPREHLGRAVPVWTSVGRLSSLLGPLFGGLIYGFGGGALAFGTVFALVAISFLAMTMLPALPPAAGKREASWEAVLAGVSFIWSYKPLLGAMTLDMVATLFGGVVALLPIFARDVLHVGPEGLGLLRSAPGFGAIAVTAVLARWPISRHAGRIMFAGMILYGAATIGFALSTSFLLSLLLLFLIGVGDMIASAVRQTLIHTCTPEDRRGRVLAANTLSNSTAGQLGQFESGLAAALLGAVGSVLFGGAAVFVIVGGWMYLFPTLRQVDRIADERPPKS